MSHLIWHLNHIEISNSMLLIFLSCQSAPTPISKPLHDMNLILIEPGSFMMGGKTDNDPPLHKVTLTHGFWLSDVEVSQKTYTSMMGKNPSTVIGDTLPVGNVTWLEALLFCNKLSQHEGLESCYTIDGAQSTEKYPCRGYRLPTEAEWEYAAKAGKQYDYAGHMIPRYVAWFKDDGATPHPIRTKKPNRWGLYDMSGNVAEWVFDGYTPYPTQPRTDPRWQQPTANRISRGGGWNSYSVDFPISTRSIDGLDWPFPWVGLRIAQNRAPE